MHRARYSFLPCRIGAGSRIAVLLAAGIVPACAQSGDALSLFKNYFVTGDYVVGGVGLAGSGVNGIATGNITISGVPANADIVAAYLYWETLEQTTGTGSQGTFRGYTIYGKSLGSRTAPCWGSGGATGAANGGPNVSVYRSDVLRYLPAQNGVRLPNGTFAVQLPDSGSGNKVPITEGASLVIVYRLPSMPLKAVVLYDGAYTMNQSTDTMQQTIKGFYQASSVNPVAQITHIVGNGQANFSERLLLNGTVLAINPFTGSAGTSWDNLTWNVSSLMQYGGKDQFGNIASVTTTVDHQGITNFDCLSWGAVVFSTTVQDTDGDGLLDTWETNGFTDVRDGTFINLPAMGANPNVKDLFIEVDYMTGADGHSHLPKQPALDMVAAAFQNAPGGPIKVHFDVGNNYQGDPAIIPYSLNGTVIAQGGEVITEASVTCVPTTTQTCTFPNQPGIVGWKSGYTNIKNQHFSHNRKDIFRYALFAHALGLPVSPPTNPPTPKSTSGIADLPGGDLMVTLGLWRSDNPADDQVGSVLVQAGTLMHELGHTLYLRHSGGTNTPNCKADYQSVMNYLFQVRGLITAAGAATIDYSDRVVQQLTESALLESAGMGTLAYRPRWYGPLNQNFLDQTLNNLGNRAATRHCDGTPLLATDPPMVRLDGLSTTGGIDWNNDGVISLSVLPSGVDVNFNGVLPDATFAGWNDWTTLDLRQVGSRRNANGLGLDIAVGDLSGLDIAVGDISGLDVAVGDVSGLDIAVGDTSGVGTQLDIDFDTASSTVDAPTGLTATAGKQSTTLSWTAPGFGRIRKYGVYRAIGAITSSNLPSLIGTVTGTPPPTTFTDTNVNNSSKNFTYVYFVTAYDGSNNQSGRSNYVTCVAGTCTVTP